MDCLNELTCSIYADRELEPAEVRQVEAHLAVCERCRALVEGLRGENRLLAAALQEGATLGESIAVPRQVQAAELAWTTVVVLGAAGVLHGALKLLGDWEPPAELDWLNPFSVTVQWNLFFSSFFYLIREGAAMVLTSMTFVGGLSLALLFIAGMLYWIRRRPSSAAVLVSLTVVLGLALPAAAVDIRHVHRGPVLIAADETIDDTLVVRAENTRVEGTITGNLIVFAGDTNVSGTVRGDMIAFSGNVRISGTVEGNVFVFAGNAEISGRVGQSVHFFCGNFVVQPSGEVAGDALAFSGAVNLDGAVTRDLVAFAGATIVAGSVGRHVRAYTDELALRSSARVGGNLTARVKKEEKVRIESGAIIAGKTEVTTPLPRRSRYLRGSFYFWRAVRLAAALVTGLVLFWLFPALFRIPLAGGAELLKTLGVGLVGLVAVPVAACLIAITLVGLPIGLVGLASWLTALYLAKIFVGAFIGQNLMTPPASTAPSALAVPLLAGLVIVFVGISLPVVGGLIHFLALLLGLGMVYSQMVNAWKKPGSAT